MTDVIIRPTPRIITASFSEADTFRQCPHKHELAYKQRWTSDTISPALSRGTAWHKIMEIHYTLMMRVQSAAAINQGVESAWVQEAGDAIMAVIADAGEDGPLLQWMYEGYCARWADEDPDWKILAVERTYIVWLPNPTGKRSSIKLKFKIDRVQQDRMTKQIWIVDSKSGKDLPKQKELDIDDQFGLYVWGMRSLGKNVFGSMHDAARTQKNKDQAKHFQPLEERFARTRLHRTDVELDTVALEAYRTIDTAWRHYRGEQVAPRAPDSDRCKWRCPYTDPCLTGRKMGPEREYRMLRDLGFTQNFERH